MNTRNIPNWFPSENDYELVFMIVDGMWREVGHNLPKYNNMLLCDYLAELGLCIPDYTQFIRIISPDYHLEYRSFGGRVRIDFRTRSCEDGY